MRVHAATARYGYSGVSRCTSRAFVKSPNACWLKSQSTDERAAAGEAATGLEFDQVSSVGTIAAVSTIKITLLSGARVQCDTPFGTVKP